jgi:hypothetical protein
MVNTTKYQLTLTFEELMTVGLSLNTRSQTCARMIELTQSPEIKSNYLKYKTEADNLQRGLLDRAVRVSVENDKDKLPE